jgi:hypothetical protein
MYWYRLQIKWDYKKKILRSGYQTETIRYILLTSLGARVNYI